ncbi:MAG: nucleotidyl transferase AbiEii/AbiGii toxin family protein [Thermoguttaceae bacterium]
MTNKPPENWCLNDLDNTAAKVIKLLDDLNIGYVFTGGITVSTYGDPRTTRDIDLVLNLDPWDVSLAPTIVEKFDNDFFISLAGCIEGIERQTMFQAIDKENMFKVDFHVSDMIPDLYERRINVNIPTGRTVPMVTPEDSILSKLVWIKMGSSRSRKDVVSILRIQSQLDWDYLRLTAKKLEVEHILDELALIAQDYDPNIIL